MTAAPDNGAGRNTMAGTHASPTEPFPRLGPDLGGVSALINFARQAPSAHNSQPWRFRVEKRGLDLLWDPSRELPHGDPHRRYLLIGLGAAAESAAIGAASIGRECLVSFDFDRAEARTARIELVNGTSSATDQALVPHVSVRHTNRLPLSSEPVPRTTLDDMALESQRRGCQLLVRTDPTSRRRFAELVREGTARNFARRAVYEEFFSLLRLRRSHPAYDRDGLTAKALGLGSLQRTLGPLFLRPRSMQVLVRTGLHRIVARTQYRLVSLSAAVSLLVAPSESPADLFSGGRGMLRMWLAATASGLRVHPMTAPMDDPDTRRELADLFGVSREASMVACFRLGFGPAGPGSPRLPLAELVLDAGRRA